MKPHRIRAVASLAALGLAVMAQAAIAAPDPDAMQALNRMGAALRDLNAYTLHVDVTYEDVLATGEKLQHAGTLTIATVRPNRLKLTAVSDHRSRELYYDGRTLTVFAPRVGYYATVAAPPTIADMVKDGQAKYGIEVPLADLFAWGTDPKVMARVRTGFDAGPEKVGDRDCEHYAFRQDSVDWQVWIQSDGPALPCKLIITTTDDLSRPQYVAVMNWDVNQVPVATDFMFTPPDGSHRIAMADSSSPKGGKKK